MAFFSLSGIVLTPLAHSTDHPNPYEARAHSSQSHISSFVYPVGADGRNRILKDQGLLLDVFNNSVLYGRPFFSQILPSLNFRHDTTFPFSAELQGTVSFPKAGMVKINCSFLNTTVAFVWINDFLVCQDGHAYQPGPASYNNPIPVLPSQAYVVRAHIYFNGFATCAPSTMLGCFNDTGHDCAFTLGLRSDALTQETCALSCHMQGKAVAGGETGNECWCGSSLSACSPVSASHCTMPCAGNQSQSCGAPWVLEPFLMNCSVSYSATVGLDVLWSYFNATSPAPFPSSWLSTEIPVPEQQRRTLQKNLTQGWNTWLSHNILSLAHLPEVGGGCEVRWRCG